MSNGAINNKYFRHVLTCLILWIIKCRCEYCLLGFIEYEVVK